MTSKLTPRIKELCSLIAKETDRQKFLQMVEELNLLLTEREEEGRCNESFNGRSNPQLVERAECPARPRKTKLFKLRRPSRADYLVL